MTFEEPLPFSEAVAELHRKQLLPTTLSSGELRAIDARIREESVLSARTPHAGYLQDVKDGLADLLAGDTNIATVRAYLQDSLDFLDYHPERGFGDELSEGIPPAREGSLQDLSSDRRLNLLLETKLRQEANRGFQLAGQDDFALYAWPAYELVRIYPRRIPRGEEERDPSESWPERWEECGGEFYDGRMIARKDDPIWSELGNSERFDDGLDSEVPPFAFGSGYGWREVSREECIELGVISEDEEIEGRASEQEEAMEIAADFDPEFLAALKADLDVAVADGRARLQHSDELSAPARKLAPMGGFDV
jgi:hypothetical protein